MSEAPLASFKETKDISLDKIVIPKEQFRTRNVRKGLEELAENIKTVGLINAITVGDLGDGRYELIAGQRRFLAHELLGAKTIRANVLERTLTDDEKKIISVTENITISPPSREDYIDACTALFRKYGTIKAVSEKLGLNYQTVSEYVKYDQLIPELKEIVDKGVVSQKTALRAQEAAVKLDGSIDEDAAIAYAREMRTMSTEGQKKMVRVAAKSPDASIMEIIEEGRKQETMVSMRITIGSDVNSSLNEYAKIEGTSREDAATTLIEEGLETRGFLERKE